MAWKGKMTELLTAEQIRKIEETLGDAPSGLVADRRGGSLNRYPGIVTNLEADDMHFNIIATERPPTEPGFVLISTQQIPDIRFCQLIIRPDPAEQSFQSFMGACHTSRSGNRPEDRNKARTFYFTLFDVQE